MKIRTISLILDLTNRLPAKNGKSRLECGTTAALPICTHLEADDRILIYEKDAINVCATTGHGTAALMNYTHHRMKFPTALRDSIEAALSLVEEDDIYILGVTDKYESWMDLDCAATCTDGLMRAVNGRGFKVYLWSIGKVQAKVDSPGVKVFNLADASELDFSQALTEIFEADKDGCPPDTMPGCFPLSV